MIGYLGYYVDCKTHIVLADTKEEALDIWTDKVYPIKDEEDEDLYPYIRKVGESLTDVRKRVAENMTQNYIENGLNIDTYGSLHLTIRLIGTGNISDEIEITTG